MIHGTFRTGGRTLQVSGETITDCLDAGFTELAKECAPMGRIATFLEDGKHPDDEWLTHTEAHLRRLGFWKKSESPKEEPPPEPPQAASTEQSE